MPYSSSLEASSIWIFPYVVIRWFFIYSDWLAIIFISASYTDFSCLESSSIISRLLFLVRCCYTSRSFSSSLSCIIESSTLLSCFNSRSFYNSRYDFFAIEGVVKKVCGLLFFDFLDTIVMSLTLLTSSDSEDSSSPEDDSSLEDTRFFLF